MAKDSEYPNQQADKDLTAKVTRNEVKGKGFPYDYDGSHHSSDVAKGKEKKVKSK